MRKFLYTEFRTLPLGEPHDVVPDDVPVERACGADRRLDGRRRCWVDFRLRAKERLWRAREVDFAWAHFTLKTFMQRAALRENCLIPKFGMRGERWYRC